MQMLDPSKGPNRPHISSDTNNFKERRKQNQPKAPYLVGAARPIRLCLFDRCRLSAAGEGLFTDGGRTPQGLFLRNMTIFLQSRETPQNMGFLWQRATRGVF